MLYGELNVTVLLLNLIVEYLAAGCLILYWRILSILLGFSINSIKDEIGAKSKMPWLNAYEIW